MNYELNYALIRFFNFFNLYFLSPCKHYSRERKFAEYKNERAIF